MWPVAPPPPPPAPAPAEAEAQKCPLHSKKASKACKFCKAYAQWVELQGKKKEDRKQGIADELRRRSNSAHHYAVNDKAPVPNFSSFPRVLADRIPKTDVYIKSCAHAGLQELVGVLENIENCDTERKNKVTLDFQPSTFICVVYRLLTVQVTEGELTWMKENDSVWVRCAAFLYVRLGFHVDRYWEALHEHLMEDEEFMPFINRGGEAFAMTVGEFVESLFLKGEYGGFETKLPLPRIPVAHRTKICRRLALFPQYRKRYVANYEVMDEFADDGVAVEVCNVDGEWRTAETREIRHPNHRCASVLVAFPDGDYEYVSIGRLIIPDDRDDHKSSSSDLTRHRGKSAQELLERHDEQQKGSAVARGKDYCKVAVQTVCVGGIRFLAGDKRGRSGRQEEEDHEANEEEQARVNRHQREENDKRARQAAIESKYCARVPTQEAAPAPDRMRLG